MKLSRHFWQADAVVEGEARSAGAGVSPPWPYELDRLLIQSHADLQDKSKDGWRGESSKLLVGQSELLEAMILAPSRTIISKTQAKPQTNIADDLLIFDSKS